MRRAFALLGLVASALATSPARLVVVGVVALTESGCTKTCNLDIATPDPLPDGRVGQPYFVQITATGECASSEFLIWDSSDPPPGMKFSDGAALDGIPRAAGRYTFTVSVRHYEPYGNWEGDLYDSQTYTLTILPQ